MCIYFSCCVVKCITLWCMIWVYLLMMEDSQILLIFISLYKFLIYWFSCLSILSFQLDLRSLSSLVMLFALLLFSVVNNKSSSVMIWFVCLIYTTLTCANQQCHSCSFLINEQRYLSCSAYFNAFYTIVITLSLTILKINKFSTYYTLQSMHRLSLQVIEYVKHF